jgi:hypothetical protein
MGAYRERPGYTGWKNAALLRAKGNGKKIVTMDPRWEGREVEYRPVKGQMLSWHVIGEPTGWVRGTFCRPE